VLAGSLSPLVLGREEVHVWCGGLLLTSEELAQCAAVLSPDERARAARLDFQRDRDRYVAGRGQLRMLAGRYLGIEPSVVAFVYGPQGKPALRGPGRGSHVEGPAGAESPAGYPLEFNVAHSQDVVLYAFCLGSRIGVDVEHVRPMSDQDAFASQFFSPAERRLLMSLDGSQRAEGFFTIWACKEAILKAIGSGLTRPINQTEVSIDGPGSVQVLSVDGVRAEAANWRLHTFEPEPGFRAALAVQGNNWRLVFLELERQP
jgi:4'-phosphopantetheinyl transferase